MVSPLQTWQHSEPKRLWLALGGLSVLVHMGVLGLSLPYLLELMSAGGSQSAAIAPPIELVLVDPADPATTPSEDVVRASEPAVPSEAAPLPEEDTPATAVSASAETDIPPESPTEASNDTSRETTPPREQPEPQSNPSTTPDQGVSNTGTQTSEPSETPQPSQNEEPNDGLPVLGGTESLPDPSEGMASDESLESSFAVSIVSHSPPPQAQQYDLKDTFPSVPEGVGAAVPLQRRAGCEWFNFSAQQWTYRVAVNADGSIDQMSLLSAGGDVREGSAIACLIERSDLTLIPAEQGGDAIYDDNLILTLAVTRQ